VIIDVHTHTPTHEVEVPAEEKKVFTGWHSGAPVSTTNSWADYTKWNESCRHLDRL